MRNRRGLALLFVALLALHARGETGFPKTLTGKVISVADGDTITLLDAQNNKERIRLAGIDAPEKKQAYSAKSKAAIARAVQGKQVRVQWNTRDKYGRILGHVYLGEEWLNLSQVEKGWVWHYRRYSQDKQLAAAELTARKEKRGLWADSAVPMAPWEFRKLPKQSKTSSTTSDVSISYWINTSSGVRHNSSCRWYGKTKRGHKCTSEDGKPCGQCGG